MKTEMIKVNCKNCNYSYEKQKDSIRRWSGFCRNCSSLLKSKKNKEKKFKICKKCKIEFPKTEEFFLFNKKGFAYSYCRNCKAKWLSERYKPSPRIKLSKEELKHNQILRNKTKQIEEWHKILLATAKSNSNRKNREFDLTEDFILDLFHKQNGKCYWFGVELIPSIETRFPQKPSLDRLNCDLGYTKDNVILSCMAANIGRSCCSEETFEKFCKLLLNK